MQQSKNLVYKLLTILVLCSITIFPLLLCDPLPLGDYANHLARMHILVNLHESPLLQQYYQINWAFIPNLAMDLIVPPMSVLLGVEQSTRIMVIVTLVLTIFGVFFLNYSIYGKVTLTPLFGFLILYNRDFLWGFINFNIGIAALLWFLGLWILNQEASPVRKLFLSFIVFPVIFITHFHAFASFCVLVFGLEVYRNWKKIKFGEITFTQSTINFSWLIPVFILLVMILTVSPTATKSTVISYSLGSKISALTGLFNNFNPVFDGVTILIIYFSVLFALIKGWVNVPSGITIGVLLLGLIALVIPQQLFGSWAVDRRLITIIAFVFVGSFSFYSISESLKKQVLMIALAIFIVRTGYTAQNWIQADKIYEDIEIAIDTIPVGTRLGVAVISSNNSDLKNPPLWEMGNLAVLRKDAFVNSLFAERGHQVIEVKYNTDSIFHKSPSQKFDFRSEYYNNLPQFFPSDRFDFILLLGKLPDVEVSGCLQKVVYNNNAIIYSLAGCKI